MMMPYPSNPVPESAPGLTNLSPLCATFARRLPTLAACLLFLSAVALLPGCAAGGEEETNQGPLRTVLAGTITNPAGTNASINIADSVYNTELDAEGRFTLVFDLEQGEYARIRIGPEFTIAYFRPGDSLDLRLDATQFDLTLTYSGTGSAINNYLAAKMVRNAALRSENNPYELDEAAFVQQARERYDKLRADLDAAELDEFFTEREKLELQFTWAGEMANYPEYHRYYASNPTFEPSSGYWDFVEQLDLNNDWNVSSNVFESFASSYLSALAMNAAADESAQDASVPPATENPVALSLQQMDLVKQTFQNEAIQAKLTGSVLREYLSYEGPEGAAPLYERYSASAKPGPEHEALEKLYRNWQALASGKPAPDFAGVRPDGSRVALSDLKGKAVYVDVWATWCGPCRAEIPHLETLQEAFAGDESVVLMSISVDDNKGAWETMVAEKELGGLQIFTEGAWQSDVIKRYLIDGIPRFMLIAPDGTISDVQAPRPSSGKVADLLRALNSAAVPES
ncbi:MAG: redoxin family protein [Bacteroidetes bacterium]|nr:redoxin family protein [Bacteroidota bacterium]